MKTFIKLALIIGGLCLLLLGLVNLHAVETFADVSNGIICTGSMLFGVGAALLGWKL